MRQRQVGHSNAAPRGITRRRLLQTTALAGAAAVVAPGLLTSPSRAAGRHMDLGAFEQAKINWRMAEGEEITVAVIPAGYFENLITVAPDFETLTGVKVRIEKIPPGQIRQKAVLDLSSRTGTYATHAADPMYYPLYVTNGWVERLDRYLGDATLTDDKWFQYEDILEGWRGVTSIDGTPYAIPFDGEATVQVYRKDVYDAKGPRFPTKPWDCLWVRV
jgi:ABC-type glycerol-3-phosphate transport system substrate-binding protein